MPHIRVRGRLKSPPQSAAPLQEGRLSTRLCLCLSTSQLMAGSIIPLCSGLIFGHSADFNDRYRRNVLIPLCSGLIFGQKWDAEYEADTVLIPLCSGLIFGRFLPSRRSRRQVLIPLCSGLIFGLHMMTPEQLRDGLNPFMLRADIRTVAHP